MKPKREQIEKFLDLLEKEEDRKKPLAEVIGKMADDSRPPHFTVGNTVDMLKIFFPEIEDWVSYWMYDIRPFTDKSTKGPRTVKRKDGTEINVIYGDRGTLKKCLLKDNLLEE